MKFLAWGWILGVLGSFALYIFFHFQELGGVGFLLSLFGVLFLLITALAVSWLIDDHYYGN